MAFIGLLGGYLARRVVGDHHRRSLVAAFFLGAIFTTEALEPDDREAEERLQRKLRLLESPYRTPQTLVGGPRLDAALMASSGRTATTKAINKKNERVIAAKAVALRPRTGWALNALFDLSLGARDWKDAERATAGALKAGIMSAEEAKKYGIIDKVLSKRTEQGKEDQQ